MFLIPLSLNAQPKPAVGVGLKLNSKLAVCLDLLSTLLAAATGFDLRVLRVGTGTGSGFWRPLPCRRRGRCWRHRYSCMICSLFMQHNPFLLYQTCKI
jgi:hypothetical protein